MTRVIATLMEERMGNVYVRRKNRLWRTAGRQSLCVFVWIICLVVIPVQAQDFAPPSDSVENSYPNLMLDISERFVAAGISIPMDTCDPIRDCIVGASITGTGRTIANTTASLASNPIHAALQLNVVGTTYTRTIGTQKRVKFKSTGTIPFTAQRTLLFDKNGFTGGVTTSCASSDNRPQCVFEPRSKLVRRIAWRKIQESRNQADQEIAQHTAAQVRQQTHDDTQKVIDEANAAYYQNFRRPLEAKGRFPNSLSFSTLNNELQVNLLKAAEGQVGADVPAPAFQLQHDIGLRIHETALENFAESLLAGHTLTDDELRTDVAKFLALIKHEEYLPHGESEDWSVSFPQQKPLKAEFRDGHYQFTISGEKWTSGEWEVDALDVTVRYKIDSSDASVRLVRDGDITIEPPKPLPLLQRTKLAIAKRVMAAKLNHLFPNEIEPRGLVVPGPWEKVGAMSVAKMVATDGWLEVCWIMPQESNGVIMPIGVGPMPQATPKEIVASLATTRMNASGN